VPAFYGERDIPGYIKTEEGDLKYASSVDKNISQWFGW